MQPKIFLPIFLVTAAIFLATIGTLSAQTVIVTDDATYTTGQASAALDVKSISKGFLAPRLTQTQRTAITSPAQGLLVYQTDGIPGFYYFIGTAWQLLSTTSASWQLTGNAGTSSATNFLGTTDNTSLILRTNNTQRTILDSLGNVAIGTAPSFTASPNQEKLLVDAGSSTSFINAIGVKGTTNNYLQLNIRNLSSGVNASSDLVATADNGDETTNFVDLGINSSANSQNIMGGLNDAYLYTTGNNLFIGTGSAKAVAFVTGSTNQTTNERMRIDATGNVGIGVIVPTAKLDVRGTMHLGTLGSVINNVVATEFTFATALSVPTANVTTVLLATTIVPGFADQTITIPALSAARGTVSLSFNQDLPAGISVAWARVVTSTTIKIHFLNTSTTTQSIPIGQKVDISIIDF